MERGKPGRRPDEHPKCWICGFSMTREAKSKKSNNGMCDTCRNVRGIIYNIRKMGEDKALTRMDSIRELANVYEFALNFPGKDIASVSEMVRAYRRG